jgi:hypothetical protein
VLEESFPPSRPRKARHHSFKPVLKGQTTMARLFPLQGPLVTGGNKMDTMSNKEPERKDFVHPLYTESLRNRTSVVNQRNVNRAIKRATISAKTR